MIVLRSVCFGLLMVFSSVVLAAEQKPAGVKALVDAEIKNLRQIEENRFSAGQPDGAGMSALAEAGVKHVIDLRTPSEDRGFDESAAVESLGMHYHALPVSGLSGLNEQNAKALHKLLEQVGDESVVVHCGSGNRVGALMAMRQAIVLGASVDEAIKTGEDWGMTRIDLEAAVKLKLLAR